MKLRQNGFTLIELLVVIAIVGIIAVFVIANVKEAQNKGKFAKIASQFQQIERAFVLAYYEENRNTWWTEAELGLGNNPSLDEIIAIESGPLSSFSTYFPSDLDNILTGTEYEYDHDGDTSTSCSNGNKHRGVNLLITDVDIEFREQIDIYLDGSLTPFCGKISYDPNDLGQKPERMFFNIFDSGDNTIIQ